MLIFIFFIFYKINRFIIFKIFPESWSISVYENSILKYSIKKNKNYYFADPFIFEYNNKYFLLVERFSLKKKVGYIDQYIFDKNFNLLSINENILNLNTHSSYPFIYYENSNIYMIPETSNLEKVLLYKFNFLDYTWELVKTLLENIILIDCNFKKTNKGIELTGSQIIKNISLKFVAICV